MKIIGNYRQKQGKILEKIQRIAESDIAKVVEIYIGRYRKQIENCREIKDEDRKYSKIVEIQLEVQRKNIEKM